MMNVLIVKVIFLSVVLTPFMLNVIILSVTLHNV
jgi:hypothetical protein